MRLGSVSNFLFHRLLNEQLCANTRPVPSLFSLDSRERFPATTTRKLEQIFRQIFDLYAFDSIIRFEAVIGKVSELILSFHLPYQQQCSYSHLRWFLIWHFAILIRPLFV